MKSNEQLKSEAAAVLGRIGGRVGKGDAKRRPPEHYQRMVQIRREKKAMNEKSV